MSLCTHGVQTGEGYECSSCVTSPTFAEQLDTHLQRLAAERPAPVTPAEERTEKQEPLFTDSGEVEFNALREYVQRGVSSALASTGFSSTSTGTSDRGVWRDMDREELSEQIAVHVVAGISPPLSREIVRSGTNVARKILTEERTGVSDVQAEVLEQVEALRQEVVFYGNRRADAPIVSDSNLPLSDRYYTEAERTFASIVARLDRIESAVRRGEQR